MELRMAKEKEKLEKLQEIYDALLEDRSTRLGVSLEEAAVLENERPLFELAAERRAERLGTTAEQLLADYAKRIKESTYPSPYCLKPDEVQEFSATGELSAQQRLHIETCQPCRSLLESSRPSLAHVEELNDNIRRLSARPKAKQSAAVGKAAVAGTRSAANLLRLPNMPTAKEFAIRTKNRPGTLGKVCRALADRGVNILAFQSFATGGESLVRFVVDNPTMAKAVLETQRLTYTEAEVAQVKLPHRPGELARAASWLGDANININYAYCGVEPGTNVPLLFFGVAEVGRAMTILEQTAAASAGA